MLRAKTAADRGPKGGCVSGRPSVSASLLSQRALARQVFRRRPPRGALRLKARS